MLSDHIQQDILLACQTGGCLLMLHESSAEKSEDRFSHDAAHMAKCKNLQHCHTSISILERSDVGLQMDNFVI